MNETTPVSNLADLAEALALAEADLQEAASAGDWHLPSAIPIKPVRSSLAA